MSVAFASCILTCTTNLKLDAEVIIPDTNEESAPLLSPGLKYFLIQQQQMNSYNTLWFLCSVHGIMSGILQFFHNYKAACYQILLGRLMKWVECHLASM